MVVRRPWLVLKRGLILFWAVWLSLVVVTNACDGLQALGVLPATFRFASGNYQAIVEVLVAAGASSRFAGMLFGAVICWEALAAGMYWRAGATFAAESAVARQPRVVMAFAVGLGLWGAFQIACEALPSPLAYKFEGTHRLLFTATLATLLAVVLLPDDKPLASGA